MSALAKANYQAESTTSIKSKHSPVFNRVKINRNFLNYPLAQDPRKRAKWGRNAAGDWTAPLPSDPRIQLTLYKGLCPDLVRCPSALDINVLFQILAEAQHNHSSRVTFPSFADLARRVGLSQDSDNRKRLKDSLTYLAEMTLTYSNWHVPHKKKPVTRTFQSPIIDDGPLPKGNKIEIKVCPEWLKVCSKNYYWQVPLPFSGEATAQRIELLRVTLTPNIPRGDEFTYEQGKKGVFKKLGLTHHNRWRVLENALKRAQTWFEEHGGQLNTCTTYKGKVLFFIKAPKVPRKSRGSSGLGNYKSRGSSGFSTGLNQGVKRVAETSKTSPKPLGTLKIHPETETGYDSKVSSKIGLNDAADAAAQEDFVPFGLDDLPRC